MPYHTKNNKDRGVCKQEIFDGFDTMARNLKAEYEKGKGFALMSFHGNSVDDFFDSCKSISDIKGIGLVLVRNGLAMLLMEQGKTDKESIKQSDQTLKILSQVPEFKKFFKHLYK
jgi:hypothetical protein